MFVLPDQAKNLNTTNHKLKKIQNHLPFGGFTVVHNAGLFHRVMHVATFLSIEQGHHQIRIGRPQTTKIQFGNFSTFVQNHLQRIPKDTTKNKEVCQSLPIVGTGLPVGSNVL